MQSVLRYPLQNRIYHLNTLAEQIPFKELQTVFPEIVNSIFGNGGMSEDWNLRTLTHQNNPFDFRLLHEFLSPTGGLFKIIYKLIGDPQTRYTLPVRLLPVSLSSKWFSIEYNHTLRDSNCDLFDFRLICTICSRVNEFLNSILILWYLNHKTGMLSH